MRMTNTNTSIEWRKVWVHSRIGEPILDTGHVSRAPLVPRTFNRDIAAKLAASYLVLLHYWIAPVPYQRAITSWQTVEFIAGRAAYCAAQAAHFSRLAS